MDNEKGWRGAITVYLSIILSSVILLGGILMDIVRIRTAEVQVRRAVNTAASSALAGYHTRLKEDYGIFAMHQNDSVQLGETVHRYMSKSLLLEPDENSIGDNAYSFMKSMVIQDAYRAVDFTDLYNYRIEGIEAVPLYNFTENEITRQQITEYMKYRAPAQFAGEVLDKIHLVSSTAELTDAYKQKTAIEKKLGKIEKTLRSLQEEIDVLNQFDKEDYHAALGSNSPVESYIGFVIQENVYEVYLHTDIEGAESEEDQEEAEELAQYAEELYENASQNADDMKQQLEDEISEAQAAAQSAIRYINSIQGLAKNVRSEIEALKSSLDQHGNSQTADKLSVTAAFRNDIAEWERLLDSENSQHMLAKVEKDLELLNQIGNSLAAIPGIAAAKCGNLCARAEAAMRSALEDSGKLDISSSSELDGTIRKVLSTLELKDMAKAAKAFAKIDTVIPKAGEAESADPRAAIEDQAKQIKEDITNALEGGKKIEAPELLPSHRENGFFPNKIFSEAILQATYEEDTLSSHAPGFDVSFEEDSSFSEDAFGFITDFASTLERYARDMRDEIYVNEYILAVFKDEVAIEDAGTDDKIKDTFFDKGEVEYILAGAPGESQNHIIIKGEILLIRFGMNTLHVYSDSVKRLHALEIATAIAGFTGFGIPVLHNMLMCAWGMAEAFQDVDALYDGESVPFIKTADTWQTDLIPGGYRVENNARQEGGVMDFNYHDYLRLLLFVQNKDVKMNRIEDLLQINMQKSDPAFQLKNYNTYLKVNAEVSIKYWFITGSFVPSRLKTADGRHKIVVEAWKGY